MLRGMRRLLESRQPDLVIEVLPQTENELEAMFQDSPYRRYRITADGPCLTERLAASFEHRDYLLTTTPLSALD